jgi:hypothetical protein
MAGFLVVCVLVTLALYFCWWKKKIKAMVLNEDLKRDQSQKGIF